MELIFESATAKYFVELECVERCAVLTHGFSIGWPDWWKFRDVVVELAEEVG